MIGKGRLVVEFFEQVKNLMNKLVNIGEIVFEDELVEQILVSLPKNHKALVNMLTYQATMLNLNELI
jgi:hypothetical protein